MMMNFEDYQNAAKRTSARSEDRALALAISSMGLAGESGELIDKLKKDVGHGIPLSVAEFIDEAGDVLWYLTDLCSQRGVNLQQVAEANIAKLRRRYPEGFVSGGGIR